MTVFMKNLFNKSIVVLIAVALVCFGIVRLFPFFEANAVGNTYYVDATSGSDANTGLSTGQAWQTINKVNISIFNAGDNILFKKDEVWREQLTVPNSGSSGSPIVFGAYGTGTLPTIYGSSLLDGSWTLVSGTIYKIALTTEAKTVVNDTTNLALDEGSYASLGAGEWDWYSNELYVNIGSNPTGGTIEAGQRSYGAALSDKDYITFENIILRNCNVAGLNVAGTSGNLVVDSVESYSNGNEGFKMWDTASATFNSVTANYNLDDGYSSHNSAVVTINNSTFSYNVDGVSNTDNSITTIVGGTISNNTRGINMVGTSGGTGGIHNVTNTTLSNNTLSVRYINDMRGTLTGVTITGGTTGVNVMNDADVDFSDLTINAVTGQGFLSTSTVSTIIEDAEIYGLTSGSQAVIRFAAGDHVLRRGKIHDNVYHGVDVYSGSTTIENSMIYGLGGGSAYCVLSRSPATVSLINSDLAGGWQGDIC